MEYWETLAALADGKEISDDDKAAALSEVERARDALSSSQAMIDKMTAERDTLNAKVKDLQVKNYELLMNLPGEPTTSTEPSDEGFDGDIDDLINGRIKR